MAVNPYQSPESQVAAAEQGFGEISFFSPKGRLNRLRYWAHTFLLMFPVYFVVGGGAALAMSGSPIFWILVVLAYLAMLYATFIIAIQRLHDLNKSGWMSLLLFIPLVNIYPIVLMIFFRGTEGRNNYGLPTPPNKTWHWVMAMAIPVVMVIGLLAAIALPAYQQYLQKAKAAQIAPGK